jgi:regulator of replication initiation timing
VRQSVATSPGGEELLVLEPDDFAFLAGLEPRSKSFGIAMQQSPPRMAVLAALWHFGPIVEPSGRATSILAERAQQFTTEPVNPTPILSSPTVAACVERSIIGKRTYEVRLVALPEAWLDAVDQLVGSGSGSPEPITPAESVVPPDDVDSVGAPAHEVAAALLEQVHALIADRSLDKLQRDVSDLSRRLGEQVGYVDKLRRELREASDELRAVKLERDGLRNRLQAAEHNLKVATSADAARIIDAEVHKRVDRIMRATPGSQHGPDDEDEPARRRSA